MLNLPGVTLIAIDTIAPNLCRLALEDTLRLICPAETILWSNSTDIVPAGAEAVRLIKTPKIESLAEVGKILWRDAPFRVSTSHFLVIQWDGWVITPSIWTNDFLNYDYIGAVWPWKEKFRVGNGGFSLRSTKLARFIAGNDLRYVPSVPEDNAICDTYRPSLEFYGFKFAPENLASRFSIEHEEWHFGSPAPFGFHDVRNWKKFLSNDQIEARVRLAGDYEKSKPGFSELMETGNA